MARRSGNEPSYLNQTISVACGAADADNLVDLVVPCQGATVAQVSATTKTAGTGTGTFGLQIKQGESSPTALTPATAVTFIDADAVAGTIHGSFSGDGLSAGTEGSHINISTVKTGTVSGNATLLLSIIWRI